MHMPRMKLVSVAATEAYMNFNNQSKFKLDIWIIVYVINGRCGSKFQIEEAREQR